MNFVSAITPALKALPEAKRLDMAVALAAHFIGLYLATERHVSAGYARKHPDREAVPIGDIIAKASEAARHG